MAAENKTENARDCKWTPLPWGHGAAYQTHSHPTRYWQCPITSSRGIVAYACGYTAEEAEANARMIVSIHDLRAACQEARDDFYHSAHSSGNPADEKNMEGDAVNYRMCRDALAKSEGNV